MMIGLFLRRKKFRQTKSKQIWIEDWLNNKESSSYSKIFTELVPYSDDFRD